MTNQEIEKKFQFPKRYQGSVQSVWYILLLICDFHFIFKFTMRTHSYLLDNFTIDRNEYMALNLTYNPLDLGQGFPDYPVPKYITNALESTANNPDHLLNQYTRGFVSEY